MDGHQFTECFLVYEKILIGITDMIIGSKKKLFKKINK